MITLWSLLYIGVKLIPLDVRIDGKDPSKLQRADLNNRIVSFIHGLFAMFFGAYHWLFLRTECGELNSSFERFGMSFSVSYFIYDFFCMMAEGLLDNAMLIHHPLSIIGLSIPLFENVSGNYCMLAIFISEISNPPMTLRHILRLTGKRYTKAYEWSEVSFISLFFFGRVVIATPIVYSCLKCEANHLFLKISCGSLMIYSLYFIVQMYYTLMRRYKEVLSRKRLGIKLMWLEPLTKTEIE